MNIQDKQFMQFLDTLLESSNRGDESHRLLSTIKSGYNVIMEAGKGRPASTSSNNAHFNNNRGWTHHTGEGYGAMEQDGFGKKSVAMLTAVMNGLAKPDDVAARELKKTIDDFESETGYHFTITVQNNNPEKIKDLQWGHDMFLSSNGEVYARNEDGKVISVGGISPSNPDEDDAMYAEKGDDVVDDEYTGNVNSKFNSMWNSKIADDAMDFLKQINYYNKQGVQGEDFTEKGAFNTTGLDRDISGYKSAKKEEGKPVRTEEAPIREQVPGVRTLSIKSARDEAETVVDMLRLTEEFKNSDKFPFKTLPYVLDNVINQKGGMHSSRVETAKQELGDVIKRLSTGKAIESIHAMNDAADKNLNAPMQDVLDTINSGLKLFRKVGDEYTARNTNTLFKYIFNTLSQYDSGIEYDKGRNWRAVRNNVNTFMDEFVGSGEVDSSGSFKGNGVLGLLYNALSTATPD